MSSRQSRDVSISQAELDGQKIFINKIKSYNDSYHLKTGKKRKMVVQTFGCQMNAHDSETLKGFFNEMGYISSQNENEADVIVYNTCCVRENAENKVYGNLGFLKNMKKENPDLKIVVCGCMMQQNAVIEKIKKSYSHVDVIFGTFNIHRFPQLLYTSMETGDFVIDVWEEHREIIEDLPIIRQEKYAASVNIMYGCDNFCTFCIVPYVRGRERSRASVDILVEIDKLANDGVKEIVLLGQNVNSYGKGLGENTNFAGLLRKINKIEGIERIRFMTSHPKDLSRDLIEAIRDCDKICKHLHLPVQSGSSNILKKMNRKYSKEKYMNLLDEIRTEVPNIAITTDIIVGFPGETEEDFQDTLDIVRHARFSGAFTFLYSVRTGTPAANMDKQVPENVAKERFNRLLELLNPMIYEINKEHFGKTLKVLAEEVNKQDATQVTGRADNNSIVHFKGSKDLIGCICDVDIIDGKTFYLLGILKQ